MPCTSRPCRSRKPCCIIRRNAALRSPWYSRSSVISSSSASASRSKPTWVPSQREYWKREEDMGFTVLPCGRSGARDGAAREPCEREEAGLLVGHGRIAHAGRRRGAGERLVRDGAGGPRAAV